MGGPEIYIAGGGPAGAAAALAARREGAAVRVFERSAAPKHKVCGEFLSPAVAELLNALGVWQDFRALAPHPIRRCLLHLGSRTKQWTLAECGWGLSRLQLDRLLLEGAASAGAAVRRGEVCPRRPTVLATGRKPGSGPGERLFGFKAHFEGPSGDAVELFFDGAGYVGVSGIENGWTNVCGIAPEPELRRWSFDFDRFVRRSTALAARLDPLKRRMDWIATGPVTYSNPADGDAGEGVYPAGDALGFVDPFTGSGILNALAGGRLAGIAAARGIPVEDYLRACGRLLGRPFRISSLLRRVLQWEGAGRLAPWVPGRALFGITRASGSALRRTLSQPAAGFPRLSTRGSVCRD